MSSVPARLIPFTLTAQGFVAYASRFDLKEPVEAFELRLIRDAPPFSLEFYRQFVRNSRESEVLQPLQRWIIAPRFYIRTITEDTRIAISPAVIEGIQRVITNSVVELSAGRLAAASIETGTDERPFMEGWINVILRDDLEGALGRATVGGPSGTIWLRNRESGQSFRGCDSTIVSVAEHELVHTMGFYHTFPPHGLVAEDFHGIGCTGQGRSARALHHVAIAYSRPPGNRDPDTDPSSFTLPQSTGIRQRPVISCFGPS